jgi:ABC-type Mn2+/Zn2+ transport system permease subunit
MDSNLLILIFTGALVGASSGFLGSFMVLKRMSLVGDALSHVALPGMAIALTMAINPMLGALVALTIAVFGIWYLGEKTEIYPEALVGVFFTASLAIGILVTPEPELLEALFGNLETIGLFDSVVTIFASFLIFFVTLRLSDKLLLGVVSEDLAKSGGIKVSKVNLIYLLLVGLVVALGVKFVGTLLTGAMVIVPAAAAKNLAKSIKSFQIVSVLIGILSAILGIIIAETTGISSGPAVVLVAITAFVISYIFKVE